MSVAVNMWLIVAGQKPGVTLPGRSDHLFPYCPPNFRSARRRKARTLLGASRHSSYGTVSRNRRQIRDKVGYEIIYRKRQFSSSRLRWNSFEWWVNSSSSSPCLRWERTHARLRECVTAYAKVLLENHRLVGRGECDGQMSEVVPDCLCLRSV